MRIKTNILLIMVFILLTPFVFAKSDPKEDAENDKKAMEHFFTF